jgi:hypothetical protein
MKRPARSAARSPRTAIVVAVLLALAAIAWLAQSGGSSQPRRAPVARRAPATRRRPVAARPHGRAVSVVADLSPSAPQVPADFLGLSFEMGELPRIAGYAGHGDLAALLRSLGPGVMRFGGVSADAQVAWTAPGLALPGWAQVPITAADLAGVARLARVSGWRVVLTLGLAHPDPQRAAREAAAAKAALGSRLAGLAMGNEPDAYARRHLRGAGWSFAAYGRDFVRYRSAVAAAAPGVPLLGPDASSGVPGLSWVRAAASLRPGLLTDHYYPSSSCGYRPVVSDLLDPRTRAAEQAMLSALARIGRQARIPLRLDETNNISCRGQAGVSDAFVSALWALDYVGRAIVTGLPGVNFHDLVGETLTYSPLAATGRRALAAGRLEAKPEFYALLLARRLLGDRPLRARVLGAGGLTATALLSRRGSLHLVLVNFQPPGSEPLLVRLRVPARFGPGAILRLTGPSPAATRGVRLGGRRVRADGSWAPQDPLPQVYDGHGALSLSLPASSAALVTLPSR